MNKVDELFKRDIKNKKIDFENFNKLCDKAKELIFIYGHKAGLEYSYIDDLGINDEVTVLSPIEQILSIAFDIYGIYINETYFQVREEQKVIYVNNQKYIADFYFEYIIKGTNENKLKTPLIIECDGFEYHSNKKQVNYDYERETNLKLQGYDIIRFTGTQIYNNPFGCVEKVYQYMQNMETIGE